MVFIFPGSSLHHAIKTAPQLTQNRYKHNIYALAGLSFNPNAVKIRKTAQFQFCHFFHDKKRLVVGHYVNNSRSRHRSNNNKHLLPPQLVAGLEKYKERIEAIVYCPREGTPDFWSAQA